MSSDTAHGAVPGDPAAAGPGASPASPMAVEADPSLLGLFSEGIQPEEFFRSWLALQCRLVGGVRDAVLVLGDSGSGASSDRRGLRRFQRYEPVGFWPEARRDHRRLAAVTEQALAAGEPVIVGPGANGDGGGAVASGAENGGAGTPAILVAQPVLVGSTIQGVVTLDLEARPDPEVQGVVRQLEWGSAWIELLLRRRDPARSPAMSGRLNIVLGLTGTILRHTRFQAAATAFATELATYLECDRVSVGFARGSKVRVRAISHSAQFGKKTNLTRAIESAMAESLDQHNVIVHPDAPDGRFQIKSAHETLAREYASGSICSVPLVMGEEHVGVVTLERPAERPFTSRDVGFCEAVAAVAGPILELQRRDDRILPVKSWDSLEDLARRLFGPGHLLFKTVTFLLAAAVVFFALARGDFRVTATSTLEGLIQRVATAPYDGYIAEAPVRAGDLVRKGDVLCVLDDRDLRVEQKRLESKREQVAKELRQARAHRDAAEVRILSAQLEQVEAQLELIGDQLSRTRVCAQLDGVVVSGDLSQQIDAPVKRGDVLFEIAPLDGYRLVLDVDESDIDEIEVGQRGELLLTAVPTESLAFRVTKVTPVSTAEEGKNFFRVEAELDEPTSRLRPGMEGIAKVTVDRRRLIWIWTYRAVDWIRLFFWKWLP